VSSFLLFRHVNAVAREHWSGDDQLRPLDATGEEQAEQLVDALADRDLERIVSSPYVRCVESVRALGAARGLEIEERMEVAEGAGREEIHRLVDELEGRAFLLCTHGDVVCELLGEEMKKGELRVVERDGDRFRTVG
jgi:8-oxo-dGTP diphosphatase